MEMDISQYKDLFITEAQEYLDSLNKCLMQLENDPENLDLITEIFRSAHTLKGMSATMGYDNLTKLAHEMENMLEHLRTGDIPVRPNVVDTLFACFDTLGEIIDSIAEDRLEAIDYEPLLAEMKAIVEGEELPEASRKKGKRAKDARKRKPEEEKAPDEGPAERELSEEAAEKPELPEEEYDLEAGEGEEMRAASGAEAREELQLLIEDSVLNKYAAIPGMRVVRLTVELDSECLLKSVRVFMVFKKLAQLGEVLGSQPPIEVLEDEQFDTMFQMGVATTERPEKLKEALLAIAEIADVQIESILEPTEDIEPDQKAARRREPTDKATMTTARKTQSVRVNIARLDKLMNLVGELVINRTRLSEISSDYDIPELNEALDQTARLSAELQDEVMKTRMVPVEHVFNRFPRMVRDLARNEGKEIDFIVEGKDIELDRTILDEISDPLVHMIRNAADHGIAVPEERRKAGKPPRGTIRLSAYRDRNYVAIEVADDGEGVDANKVFDLAERNGLVTGEERRQLAKEDLLRVLALPGFSTSEEVSGVSGRGVGMDAVKSKAESLGGFVLLESTPGIGTRVTLKLPLTLAIVQALMVEVAGEVYAIPLGTVREAHEINPEDIKTVQNQEAIFIRDETIPLLRLDQILDCERILSANEPLQAVVTEIGPKLLALGVHSLIGQQEVVISSMDKFLKRVEGFAGATIMGTGRVALILDIPGLL
ncbi:MAG: chemotaxis protein CheA [Actinobacteria bacterium]|nr:chemotaxis protein CheA [Actinomycetota bacterium]